MIEKMAIYIYIIIKLDVIYKQIKTLPNKYQTVDEEKTA